MVARPPHAADKVKCGYIIITAMADGLWTRAGCGRGWQQHVQNAVSMYTEAWPAVTVTIGLTTVCAGITK